MRVGAIDGRLCVQLGASWFDVHRLSEGQWGPDPMSAFDAWEEFRAWAETDGLPGDVPCSVGRFTLPVPAPAQVFAVGLNYGRHSVEVGMDASQEPLIFTKFQSCLTGPFDEIELPSADVDFEVELVAVIGKRARRVEPEDAWDYVAGLTLGQDLSERVVQMNGEPPQFSIGKSYPGFGPLGPMVVTPDEFEDPDDIEIYCEIQGGEKLQWGRTRDMRITVPQLISWLSMTSILLPGDLIFTGTPDGVGMSRNPPRFLAPGEVLVSGATGIGEMVNPLAMAD